MRRTTSATTSLEPKVWLKKWKLENPDRKVTSFSYSSNTTGTLFSIDLVSEPTESQREKEKNMLTAKDIKDKYPDIYQQIFDEGVHAARVGNV